MLHTGLCSQKFLFPASKYNYKNYLLFYFVKRTLTETALAVLPNIPNPNEEIALIPRALVSSHSWKVKVAAGKGQTQKKFLKIEEQDFSASKIAWNIFLNHADSNLLLWALTNLINIWAVFLYLCQFTFSLPNPLSGFLLLVPCAKHSEMDKCWSQKTLFYWEKQGYLCSCPLAKVPNFAWSSDICSGPRRCKSKPALLFEGWIPGFVEKEQMYHSSPATVDCEKGIKNNMKGASCCHIQKTVIPSNAQVLQMPGFAAWPCNILDVFPSTTLHIIFWAELQTIISAEFMPPSSTSLQINPIFSTFPNGFF